MEPTADPHVFIEERREGYVRYQADDGRRWEVHGICDKRGDCMVGAVVDDHVIETLEEAQAYIAEHPMVLDVPVAPGFSGCCPLEIVEL